MKICIINYNEPPGAKWNEISVLQHEHNDLIDFVISDEIYKKHITNLPFGTLYIKSKITTNRRINQLYFVIKTLKFLWSSNYDKYVILSQPPFFYILASFILRIRERKYILYPMDLYPESLFTKKSGFAKILYYLAKPAYNHANKIIVIGRDMKNKLIQNYGLEENKFTFIRNWPSFNYNINTTERTSSLSNERYAIYAGNMGYSHDFRQLLKILQEINANKLLDCFYFIGNGKKKSWIMSEVNRLKLNEFVRFLDFIPDLEFLDFVEGAKFHAIVLENSKMGVMVPSKFYTSLLVRRPVAYFGHINSELSLDITEYGLGEVFIEEDTDLLLKIERLITTVYKENIEFYLREVNNSKLASYKIVELLKE